MNKQDQYDEDLLRRFIKPERIEKAPEGFTSKTLTRIQIETQLAEVRKNFLIRNRIPVITVVVTAALIIAAVFVPVNGTESIGTAVWQNLRNIELNLPQLNISYIQEIRLPGWIGYAAIAFLSLTLFDMALLRIFHKKD